MRFIPVSAAALLYCLSVNAQQQYPDTIWLDVTFYDFHSNGSNQEFEVTRPYTGGVYPNMVADTLDAEKKPILGPSPFFNYGVSKWFRPWLAGDYRQFNYTDNTGRNGSWVATNYDTTWKNMVFPDSLPFLHLGNGVYQYLDSAFFKLDGRGFGAEGKTDNNGVPHNYSFTMELHTTFTYKPGQTFYFLGDDDVWVFVNGQKVMDLGGIHVTAGDSFLVDNIPGLVAGRVYNFDFFYAERHTVKSTIKITTNMFAPPAYLRFYGQPGAPGGANLPLGPTGSLIAGVDDTIYGHIFDTTNTWKPEYDDYIIWELVDSTGRVIKVLDTGVSAIINYTEAYTNVTLRATFRNPNPPFEMTQTTQKITVFPGPAHHITVQRDSVITNWRDDDTLSTLTIPEGVDTMRVFAVVRDQYGNYVRYATQAGWSSADEGVVIARPTPQRQQKGVIIKRAPGMTSVTASEGTLAPDDFTVITIGFPRGFRKLVKAVTRDMDGDGYLDRLELHFDSTVTEVTNVANNVAVSAKYGSTTISGTTAVASNGGTSDSIFYVALTEVETKELQTGWLPLVTVNRFGTASGSRDFPSVDGAGAVIYKALYLPPRNRSDAVRWDTIKIVLSEPVASAPFKSLSLAPRDLINYYLLGTNLSASALQSAYFDTSGLGDYSKEYRMIVSSVEVTVRPDTDRVQLKGPVPDPSGNNPPPPNIARKALIEWGAQNNALIFINPNPFVPGVTPVPQKIVEYYSNVVKGQTQMINGVPQYMGTIIAINMIKPLKQQTDGTFGTATIYDMLGNIIMKSLKLKVASSSTIKDYGIAWDGRNENGRMVGAGTYLCIVTMTDVDGKKQVKRAKIGVKRQH
jgi:fibro-slime domain-containing protein